VVKRSYGSVKVFWLDSGEALRRLRQAAGSLLDARPEVLAVYLFGSLAEGRAVPGSDADILIVVDRTDRPWTERPLVYAAWFENVGLPVEIFCYTVEEAGRISFARRAREGGATLAHREG
jgi:predicted nucleotidyltransferase